MLKKLSPLVWGLLISILISTNALAQVDIRFAIAVFPFARGGEVSKGDMEKFTAALRTQFIESGRYEVISHEDFKSFMREKKLTHWDPVPDSLFEETSKSLGAKLVVGGVMKKQPDGGFTIDAKLIDVTTKREKTITGASIPAGIDVAMLANALINNVFMQIDTDKFLTFGRQYLKNRNYERAEENFLKVEQFDPTHAECHYYLGNTYLESGDTTQAVERYETAVQYDSAYADAYAKLATVYQARNDIMEASKIFSRLLELEPDNLSYRLNYASVLFQNEKYTDAIGQYEESLKIDSTRSSIWMGLGLSYYKMESWQEALEPLEKASSLDGSDVNNLVYLVSSYHKLKDYSGATSAYERIVSINPSYPKAYLNLGLFYQKLKKNDKAIIAFKSGTQHSPEEDLGEIYLSLANALNKDKKYSQAISAANEAVKKGASVRKCYMIIGDAYQDLGESLEAADTIEKYMEAISFYVRSSEAYQNVLQDPKFGKYAKANIERNTELKKRAELIIKKKELGG